MIETIGTVRFNLRTDKALKDGSAPIELIYSISQQRKYFNTGLKINPIYWEIQNQRGEYHAYKKDDDRFKDFNLKSILTKAEISKINSTLEILIIDIHSIEGFYKANKISFTSEMVLNTLKEQKSGITKKAELSNYLFDFMDQYIIDHQSTREAGSLTVYKSVKNHLKAYQDATRHAVTFDTIDYNFFNRFQTFLINRTTKDKAGVSKTMLNNTTIAKALSTLKTFLTYAKMQGIEVNQSYKDFSIKKEKLEVIALEQEDLDAIIKLDLSGNKRLSTCRDIFVFACSTGVRYSDYAQLRREHINNDVISLVVKKTKTELTIPLNSMSAAILDKYIDNVKPLPLVSNQNLNYSIKDLCKLANIDSKIEIVRYSGKKRMVEIYPKYELIHFHTARKTFVTLSLEKGMSAEEVMEITGHSDYRSFKRYVKVTEKRKVVVMNTAWGKPEFKLKVV